MKMIDRRIPVTFDYNMYSVSSYGIILYAHREQKWLVVQRKHSFELLLLLQGMYRPTYLHLYCQGLHRNEIAMINRILTEGDQYLRTVYRELRLSFHNFHAGLYMFIMYQELYRTILASCRGRELQWNFPRGRNEYCESGDTTARREFAEEVGCSIPDNAQIVSDKFIEDRSTSLFDCRFFHYYKIYRVPHIFDLPPVSPTDREVAARKWIDDSQLEQYHPIGNPRLITELRRLITHGPWNLPIDSISRNLTIN